ncbi:ATP synthase-coupling factor 6, mitochondrial [Osmia bicornis bicornis]|uniref:ATP synthase-coupling factor 6, mitochondrial n=1 Tax=Osmia bicornis bicornis TaxID=1437191 RepID=UPI0010F4F2D4|nr:ATP synthase-coupling factor 6, mitochondrial [Osmia bicornis bicornis]
MLSQRLAINLPKILKRNFGITAPAFLEAKDPIQKLFIEKIREYKTKSSGGKLVDPSPETEKERASELDRLQKQYNPTNSNMSEFPKFQFKDPDVTQ